LLDRVVVSPACGLANASPDDAVSLQRACIDVARYLAERAQQ
jgi:hypothetical protein